MRLDVDSLSVARLRQLFAEGRCRVTPYRLRQLRRDRRRGVRLLARQLTRQLQRQQAEERRRTEMRRLERAYWGEGVRLVAGVDEVGVGPLAGPVVAAAVVLPPGCALDEVDDSKKLDPEIRLTLEGSIRCCAVALAVGEATVDEIDRLNVYQAGLLAMKRAVAALDPGPEQVLVDARRIPGIETPQEAVAGGDGCSVSIAAASIIAKTHRDRLMEALDRLHPNYGFASHKGYCTPRHQAALRRYGPSPIHRRSFKFLREVTGQYGTAFYALRDALTDVGSLAELAAIEARTSAAQLQLSDDERRKLSVLIGRRRRRLGGRR